MNISNRKTVAQQVQSVGLQAVQIGAHMEAYSFSAEQGASRLGELIEALRTCQRSLLAETRVAADEAVD